jgi:hypothetical protein
MNVTIPVAFKTASLTAAMGTFIQTQDADGRWSDFRQFGNWGLVGGPQKAGPYVVFATPATGIGNSQSFPITYGRTSSPALISQVHLRFASAIVGAVSCHAVYFPMRTRWL